MMSLLRSRAIAFVALMLVAGMGAGLALAHGGATGIVKERMDLMKGIGDAMKRLTAMFKGEAAYDAEAVREAARAINARAGDHITKLFPEGSLHKPTEALPTIWQDWPTFERYANDMKTYSAALEAAAGNAPGPMHGEGARPGATMGGGAMMGDRDAGRMMGAPGGAPIVGGGGMGSDHPMSDPRALAQMPPMASFMRLTETCNACHTRFRVKK